VFGLWCLTLRQPYASLVAPGPKWIETRDWQPRQVRPPFRIGIHAGAYKPKHSDGLPGWAVSDWPSGLHVYNSAINVGYHMPLGALIATATVVDCCPIGGPTSFRTGTFEGDEGDLPGQAVLVHHPDLGHGESLVIDSPDAGTRDISDQLPFGDFTPGRVGWLLYDRKPTTERCPACWGEGGSYLPMGGMSEFYACSYCTGGYCDPVPMAGQLGLWKWTP
jgi:hypothetical protein